MVPSPSKTRMLKKDFSETVPSSLLKVVPSRYIESYIVSSVDKYCAIKESMDHYFEFFKTKKLFRYVYLSLCLMFIQNI